MSFTLEEAGERFAALRAPMRRQQVDKHCGGNVVHTHQPRAVVELRAEAGCPALTKTSNVAVIKAPT